MLKKLVGFGCVAIILSSFLGCSESFPKEPGRYYDNKFGFSVVLPAGWKKMNYPGMAVVVETADQAVTFGIGAVKLVGNNDLAQSHNFFISGYQNQGFSAKESEEINIAGFKANKTFLTGSTISIILYDIVKSNFVYMITGTAASDKYDFYKEDFDKIVQSFRFEK